MFKINLIFIFLIFWTLVNSAKAKVEPKNYDFTFDKLKTFYPGTTLEKVKQTYPKLELVDKASVELYKVNIIHVRYKFPLFFQVKDGAIIDFYARLPSYFIHDIFHQSLINRFGKQDHFYNKDGTSIYMWNNADNFLLTYSGACTITCFPIYLHVIKNEKKALQESFLLKSKKIFK